MRPAEVRGSPPGARPGAGSLARRMGPIFQRALRAAMFDRRTFDEVSGERSATADSVVLVAAVAAVVSVASFARFGLTGLVSVLLQSIITNLAGWLFLAVATWFAGTRLFRPPGDYRRDFDHAQAIMRVQGVAYLPVVLAVVPAVLDGIGVVAGAIGTLWYLAAASYGTAVALDIRPFEGGIAVLLGAAGLYLLQILVRAPFALFSGLL